MHVFISFRNEDEPYAAAAIALGLSGRLGRRNVFRSSECIDPGREFAVQINENLAACDALVAVIGPRWAGRADDRGRTRLSQRHDWVRLEISTALRRGVKIVPVLLDGVPRLERRQLPPSLVRLAQVQSLRLDHRSLRSGVEQIIGAVTGHRQ